MPNFLDSVAETEHRLGEYSARLFRIEAHLRRDERRAARAQLAGFVQELAHFADEMEFPLETMVVGAQLGFFSGGSLLRGRIPASLVGAAAGWLYGQQAIQRHRALLDDLLARLGQVSVELLEAEVAAAEAAKEAKEAEKAKKAAAAAADSTDEKSSSSGPETADASSGESVEKPA